MNKAAKSEVKVKLKCFPHLKLFSLSEPVEEKFPTLTKTTKATNILLIVQTSSSKYSQFDLFENKILVFVLTVLDIFD